MAAAREGTVDRTLLQAHRPPRRMPDSLLHHRASPGQSLDRATLAVMEPRFGRDFSGVRVHTDAQASEAVASLGARAVTRGDDVFFGAGRYAPQSPAGSRLLAHELGHVVQQRKGGASTDARQAERRAGEAAAEVIGGGRVAPEALGGAAPGLAADDGKEPELKAPSKLVIGPLVGPLKIRSSIVAELMRRGMLSPDLIRMIESGQIEVEPDPSATPSKPEGPSPPPKKDFALEFNRLPYLWPGVARPAPGLLGFDVPSSALTPKSTVVGGYLDPVLGWVPPQKVTLTPSPAPVAKPAAAPGWLQEMTSNVKTSFDFSEGLSFNSISHPGLGTSIWVTGVTQKLFKAKGFAGQLELGWTGSVGFQLSYRSWFLHGDVDPDGKWKLTLSFPSDAPLPVLPWLTNIFREGAVAVQGFTEIAAEGPPDLKKLDELKKRISPHIDRTKNAVDAAKGIAKAGPGVSASLMVGAGPGPGAPPAEKPSGIFFGAAIKVSF